MGEEGHLHKIEKAIFHLIITIKKVNDSVRAHAIMG